MVDGESFGGGVSVGVVVGGLVGSVVLVGVVVGGSPVVSDAVEVEVGLTVSVSLGVSVCEVVKLVVVFWVWLWDAERRFAVAVDADGARPSVGAGECATPSDMGDGVCRRDGVGSGDSDGEGELPDGEGVLPDGDGVGVPHPGRGGSEGLPECHRGDRGDVGSVVPGGEGGFDGGGVMPGSVSVGSAGSS